MRAFISAITVSTIRITGDRPRSGGCIAAGRRIVPLAFLLYLALFAVLILPAPGLAADITLNLAVEARDDWVTVKVANTGADPAQQLQLKVELDGEVYQQPLADELPPRMEATKQLQVRFPRTQGSYPLLTTVSYNNGARRLSVINAGYFHYVTQNILETPCTVPTLEMGARGIIKVNFDPALRYRLFVPEEVSARLLERFVGGAYFALTSTVTGISFNSTIFGVAESSPGEAPHGAKICNGRLATSMVMERSSRFGSPLVAFLALFGVALSGYAFRRSLREGFASHWTIISRYAFSVFVVSAFLLLYRHLHAITSPMIPPLQELPLYSAALAYVRDAAVTVLRWTYFEGGNYDYFFSFIADPLYAYIVFINWYVLWKLIRPSPENDKYWHLLARFYTLPLLRRLLPDQGRAAVVEPRRANCALLAILVKAYYLPLIWSWVINQSLHVAGIASNAHLDFQYINVLAVDLCVLIDVAIFTCGYTIELPQLRNQIRSVEPTIFGWFVCLFCYPPFNNFSFRIFDYPLNDQWAISTGFAAAAATVATTLLWGVYTWASVALAWRSSNLTNRGIVSHGPYRYVRHPAYTAKVTLWCIASFFFAQFSFFLACGYILIYSLRAWTEERHLSRDPDYIAYKQKVRWRILPGVF